MKRRKKLIISVVVLALALAAVVTAYYLFFEPGKGSTTTTIGSPTADGKELELKPQEGVSLAKPGDAQSIKLWVTSLSGAGQQVKRLTVTPSVDAGHPGCSASWFKATGTGRFGEALGAGATSPIFVPANAAGFELDGGGNGTLSLEFTEESSTNQNACSGATVTWAFASTG